MNTFSIIAVIILFILGWFFIDFALGRKLHLKNINKKTYPYRESDIDIFTSGPGLFRDFFAEIKRAKKHIHILFYIVKDDRFSFDFLMLLKEKANEGVEVRLMLDWLGSHRVKRKLIRELKAAGVEFAFTQLPKPPFFFYSSQVRNHRKVTIIDGKIGYMGGYNIGKEYIDLKPKLSPWRDYHLKIQGEGVQDLQHVFLSDWNTAAKVNLLNNPAYFPELYKGKTRHQIVPTEGIFLEDNFSFLIRNAEDSITIGSPYFIPGKKAFHDLIHAVKSGVKLNILVPSTADHPLVKEASYYYLRRLIKRGAKVYLFKNGFYHAKTLMIDDKICDIGTANFDKRSFYLNYELNCYSNDHHFIEKARSILKEDMSGATILTLKDLNGPNPWRLFKEACAHSISLFL